MIGIKEGTGCNENWVLYATDESLNSTPETNNTLYVKIEFKFKKFKKNKHTIKNITQRSKKNKNKMSV